MMATIDTNKMRANTIRVNFRIDKLSKGLKIKSLANKDIIEIEMLTYSVISGGNPFFKNT